MRITASRDGPVARQKTWPASGSIHARSKCTPSSFSIARSRSCASWSWAAVTPTNPEWTSMNLPMRCLRAGCSGAPNLAVHVPSRRADDASVIRPMDGRGADLNRAALSGRGRGVEVRIEDRDPRDPRDRQAVALPRAADRLGTRGVVDAPRRRAVVTDVRMDPRHAEVFVDPDDAAADVDTGLAERQLEPIGKDPFDQVARHRLVSSSGGRISAVRRGS